MTHGGHRSLTDALLPEGHTFPHTAGFVVSSFPPARSQNSTGVSNSSKLKLLPAGPEFSSQFYKVVRDEMYFFKDI